jgi:predicted membrane GTPase involved in stress response
MTLGINTWPLAGREGDRLTASQLRARLEQELVGNISLWGAKSWVRQDATRRFAGEPMWHLTLG